MSIRLHILYEFRSGPWGGGNQFLKALKTALQKRGAYAEQPEDADAILINSHHFGEENRDLSLLQKLKQDKPEIPIIHRIDGPVQMIRGHGRAADKLVFTANRELTDGTIFQTAWSHDQSMAAHWRPAPPVTVIGNAPDPALFYPPKTHTAGKCLRVIATSWAANERKGFDILRHLDQHLDFTKFEVTFIGNSPCAFQNISTLPPQNSKTLGESLRAQDIYLAASRNDPCSNALGEALACGLPALARNSGGHPEIVGDQGLLFEGKEDILAQLDRLAANYPDIRARVAPKRIEDIAQKYLAFCAEVKESTKPRTISVAPVKRAISAYKLADRIGGWLQKIKPSP